ncbi:MAG: aspartate aminotransferase family protein [Actinomycetota bacterium]|nr:aminotransferase class III-fold pyridoxal phosphate-dependent enzyme [Actinomycetota bacterium]
MGSIRLVTEVPGPRSRTLSVQARESIAHPLVPGGQVFIERGEGAVVEDVDGNRFIDFIGGVGCLVVGHSHPHVVSAINEQVSRFTHTDFSISPYESYLQLAGRLSDMCGGGRKAGFFNSGAEAVENAIKVAKGATGKTGIICFENAFHGRTLMALSLTGRDVPYKAGFGPFAPEVYRAPYAAHDSEVERCLEVVSGLIQSNEIGGLIIEPIQGEGGFVPPAKGLLESLFDLCERANVVFIADEIQSGYGRTGSFLASEQSGIRPHLVVLGKSIAAGLPLSAIVGDPRFMDALVPNALGGTYVGNPVACAAALAVLDVMKDQDLVARARDIGARLEQGWGALASGGSSISSIRGLGAMIGVEFGSGDKARRVINRSLEAGVLAMTAGPKGDVIRHLMPLVISDDQLDETFDVFEAALRD